MHAEKQFQTALTSPGKFFHHGYFVYQLLALSRDEEAPPQTSMNKETNKEFEIAFEMSSLVFHGQCREL